MKKDDQEILKEVQKNSSMAINAINTISEKVHDNALQQELSKQKLWYSVIQNKATDRLQNERAKSCGYFCFGCLYRALEKSKRGKIVWIL